jgi:hypothetical protein
MSSASGIFVSGLVGVFTGIALLYLLMKALTALAGSRPDAAPKND